MPARPKSIGRIPVTVRSTRKGSVRLQVQRGGRTYTRTIRLRRAGKREVTLRLPLRLAREDGLVTIKARLGNATARARLQPSFCSRFGAAHRLRDAWAHAACERLEVALLAP